MTRSAFDQPHIVLCGPLRSGTTLLRLMIGQHSQVVGRNESDLLFDALSPEGIEATDGEAYKAAARADMAFELMGFREPTGTSAREVFEDLVVQHEAGDRRLLLTLHRHFERAAELLPNAFFIRLRRDPRDVALSSVAMGWGGKPYFGVQPWVDAETSWRSAEAKLPRDRWVEIFYDDLVNDPRATMGKILSAAGLPFEEETLSPPSDSTYDAPRPRAPDAWKRKLSEREAAEINYRLAPLEEGCGFALEPKSRPSAVRLVQIWLAAKIERMRFEADRYGFGSTVKMHFAKRFGSEELRAKVFAERRAVHRQHLK